jgi:Tfp pilus assembly protein PilO
MRRTGLLAGLSVVLVTAVWWMFLITPRNTQIADLETELNIAIDTESRLRVQIQQLEEIRDAEVQYLAGLGTLEGLIPERPLLEEFIEQIFALTNDTGVVLQSLSPSLPAPVDQDSELREIAVSVAIEGQFFEVLGFLFGLTDMERLVRIDAIAAASSQDETEGTLLSASLELTLFTLADLLPVFEEVTTPTPGDGTTDATTPDDGFEANDGQPTAEGDGG